MSDGKYLIILGKYQIPSHFLEKHFTHAGGHGGQNVNKVATKVQLKFIVDHSPLPKELKERLMEKFPRGHLEVACSDTRHQHQNLEIAYERMQDKINEALYQAPERKATKPFYKTWVGKIKKIRESRRAKWRNEKNRNDERY
jgi:ribosome-associated protein